MEIFAIVIVVSILLYLMISYVVAKFCGVLLFTPPVNFRPTKEQVITNMAKEFASNHTMYANANYEAYEKWETEYFECDNNGVQIPAAYHPMENARGCVILAHGFGQNRYASVPYAEIFRNLGFSTILFDERCFGESKAAYCSFGELEATDIVALIGWVKQRCGADTKIILHGVSMGAMSSMIALGLTDKIDYVIEDCGLARTLIGASFVIHSMIPLPNPLMKMEIVRKAHSFGLQIEKNMPIKGVQNSNVPVCVIHGDADTVVPVSDAKEIYAVCKNEKSRLEIFPGRVHGYSICDRERYESVLADFLKDI